MTPRLLLVEDDPVSRAFLATTAEALPAVVDVAGSCADALALAAGHDYALWAIDARLPDGSGAGLLARLRARGLAARALAHTAAHGRDELDALYQAGFDVVVCKPLPAADWQRALREALAGTGAPAARADGVRDAADEVPVWDDAAALAAMNGNRAHVDAMRGLFLAELPATRAQAEAALAAEDHAALSALLHRLRAGCGFVGAARLQAAAARLREAPDSPGARRAFLDALQDTTSS